MKASAGAGIVGVGLVAAAGNTADDVLDAAREGGVRPRKPAFTEPPPAEDVFGYGCSFPEASEYIKPARLRRLGRVLTMGLLAAKKAVSELGGDGLPGPETSVYVATGLGSLAETAAFVENMIRLEERFPKPAHFVNSVHNAAASQLAIEFGLKGENLTFTHRETSFEAALWQALRGLQAGRSRYAIVGGADELNRYHLIAGKKKRLWKDGPEPLAPLSGGASSSKGTLPGEGAAMCVLAREAGDASRARLGAARFGRFRRRRRTYLDIKGAADFLEEVLRCAGAEAEGVDLLLSGANGDCRLDGVYRSIGDELSKRAGRAVPHGTYKQLCGDYYSAGAFGFALGALALRRGSAPRGLFCDPGSAPSGETPVRTVLLYNLSRFGTHGACVLQR